jgi:hypothetical protein
MNVKLRIFQIQPTNIPQGRLYYSSITCSGIIYLKPSIGRIEQQTVPYFLKEYSITVDRESIFKTISIIKVEAISMNPKNFMPISYSIVASSNFNENLFTIDNMQGFIYPKDDLSLKPNIYSLKVKATDPTDQSYAITNVKIVVELKKNNQLICNTNYLVIRLNTNGNFRFLFFIDLIFNKQFCYFLRINFRSK